MSIHGAEIQTNDEHLFSIKEQLVIILDTPSGMSSVNGEFIRFPAKVRRVLVDGQTAAISWEHLDEFQRSKLLEYVLLLSRKLLR